MKDSYDIIVVGAGPAGSTAARYAALAGASVLLLEKDREIGIPVRCAEGVTEKGLEKSIDQINSKWIDQEISSVAFYSPSDLVVELDFNEKGFILNRRLFDYDLAQMAIQAGAQAYTKAYVFDLLFNNNKVTGIKFLHLGKEYKVKSKIVIGADGIESRVGRWAGLKTCTQMKDMETCVQFTARDINLSPTHIHLFFSSQVAPQGYLWIFPKSNGLANVGLGISGSASRKKAPIVYLNEFIQKRYPKSSILYTVAGGVPCDKTLKNIVADGLMLVGDAAHQVNPIKGAGIASGMLAGRYAGQVAAAAISEGDVSAKRLHEYEKKWYRSEGKNHDIFYKLKSFVYQLTDEELDGIARVALDVPLEKRALMTLFKTALIKKPSLLLDAVKVFT